MVSLMDYDGQTACEMEVSKRRKERREVSAWSGEGKACVPR